MSAYDVIVIGAGPGGYVAARIGPSVSELVAVFSLALSLGATREQLVHTIFPHPTLSEALHEATLASGARAIHA